jgi:hypothetical protein
MMMIKAAGAPKNADGLVSIFKTSLPIGTASICRNHGVNMKAMNIPVYTINQDEYKNIAFAFLDTSQLDIAKSPLFSPGETP